MANSPNTQTKVTTSASFRTDVLQESLKTPVLVEFWAPSSAKITPSLERIVKSAGGKIKLATMNVEDHPQIAAQLGVQLLDDGAHIIVFAESGEAKLHGQFGVAIFFGGLSFLQLRDIILVADAPQTFCRENAERFVLAPKFPFKQRSGGRIPEVGQPPQSLFPGVFVGIILEN